MGITLDLRLIDHERIAVRGLQVVHDALGHGDPEILRRYLAELPIDIDPAIVEFHTDRLSRLRDLSAPEVIIRNEERFLHLANGAAYRPEEFQHATLDELRQLLGTWCWVSHSYSLDKVWDELHWFLEPIAGPEDRPLSAFHLQVADSKLSVFSKAFQGESPYPNDDLGEPIIRTLGSHEPGCSGYNPPPTCAVILEALQRVDPAAWEEHVPFRGALYRRAIPDMDNEEIAGQVEHELAFAREAFSVLVSAYSKAVEKGFGMSCEYSL
ncbi:MAG TPA: hypothetical protein VKU02_07700 [Gemmataceae bacterium]|nr:hypothetical protein [Gemmataceae bacterium]